MPGRLAVAPRPRGGDWLDDEMLDWKKAGVNVIVFLLADDEVREFALEKESELYSNTPLLHCSNTPIIPRLLH
jgi:hypothetical protein